jgi:hypothetical protein
MTHITKIMIPTIDNRNGGEASRSGKQFKGLVNQLP